MNITFIGNPYLEGETTVYTRGTLTDAKIAKLNNATKRPAIVSNWIKGVMNSVTTAAKDFVALANKIGVKVVNYAREVYINGSKKLRVNGIVSEKAQDFHNNSEKIDVIPRVEEQAKPIIKLKEEPAPSMEPIITQPVTTRSDIHGRHEHTGPIDVEAIKEAIKNDVPPVSTMPSRAERNAMASELVNTEEVKESKVITPAGDPDLIFNTLHKDEPSVEGSNVFKKLEEVKNERLKYEAEMAKINEQTQETIVNIADVKEKIASSERAKEEKAKQELAKEIALLEDAKQEVLEKTKYLTSLRQDLAEYEAKQAALNDNNDGFYTDYRSRGGMAA